MVVASWNINSARLRVGLIAKLLEAERPDVLCLQETKATVEQLPQEAFAAAGYPHVVARGEKGYNGVAILSRHPLEDAGAYDFCARGDARHVAARVAVGGASVTVHSVYTPAGGDAPDPETNDKFAHKLQFLDEMATRFAAPGGPSVVVGDFNVAPLENDVWSHKQMLKVVSHTPVEVEKLTAAQARGGWIDAHRARTPPDEKLYSWWSYRARDWAASDRGRRLDHIWLSPDLKGALAQAWILRAARGWEGPSDHAPVLARLTL
ncbi:MAG: exodeoxyribonuclease III [Pseudomonadota bacterium]